MRDTNQSSMNDSVPNINCKSLNNWFKTNNSNKNKLVLKSSSLYHKSVTTRRKIKTTSSPPVYEFS